MAESDTIRLLKECDSGIKMGIISINETIQDVKSASLNHILAEARKEHEQLQTECVSLLNANHDSGKSPSPIAQGMGKMKTTMRMVMSSDTTRTAAHVLTDGCNMGITSLNTYLNQYKAASNEAKDLARKIIRTEEDLLEKLKAHL